MKKISLLGLLMMLLIGVFSFEPVTAQSTCGAGSFGITTYGQSGLPVQSLQQCLIEAGFAIPAGATGYYGEQTRTAVKAFYRDALGIADWAGNSVGPIGRSKLASGFKSPVANVKPSTQADGYKVAGSALELQKYLNAERGGGFGNTLRMGLSGIAFEGATIDAISSPTMLSESSAVPERFSETNVQIVGIDEPDIVKTDGENIFISNESGWYGHFDPMPRVMPDVSNAREIAINSAISGMPYFAPKPTVVIDAYPVDDMKLLSKSIPETGEMLLIKDQQILVIFSQPKIVAYNVQNPQKPVKLWDKTIQDNTSIITSRLLDNTIYLVTATYLDHSRPCPIVPLRSGGQDIALSCADMLVPNQIEPVSHAYTVLKIDPADGFVTAESAIVGDNLGMTTVMMSANNLYLASQAESASSRIMAEITIDSLAPYVPTSVVERARDIMAYDISDYGKMNEIASVFEKHLSTLGSDERMRIENEMQNRLRDSLKKRIREMVQSRIVRLDLDSLQVEAVGMIPGYLLNQFAMDEHEGNLRVAVTVDDNWGGAESANDVYVLDSNLSVIGQIQDLGLTERIYSVRFMGDTGYLVTFRQIDPFYVLDLGEPTAPKMVGELKIPGYSAYLEYLGNDLVLGVGREGNGVKLSIFDVSNPAKPTEKSKYQLKDYWTEVEGNHRAFLRDEKHEVFFIPGGEGGYVFSYKNGELVLKKTIAGQGVKRALYIDDYLYIVSNEDIRVLDENTWKEVKKFSIY